MERAKSVGVAIIPFLLALYVAPVFVVGYAAMMGNLQGGNAIGAWFLSLIASPDTALNLFHKVLLPITAGVTVATMWQRSNGWWTIVTVAGLLISIAVSIFLQVQFGVPDTQKNMIEQASNPRVKTTDEFFALATSFMTSFQENLATYLLVLLGLQAIPDNTTSGAPGKSAKDKETEEARNAAAVEPGDKR